MISVEHERGCVSGLERRGLGCLRRLSLFGLLAMVVGVLPLVGLLASPASAASLFTPLTTPAVASWNDNPPAAVELGVAFTSDTSGFIDSLRFYKGADNTGTHVGSLWTPNVDPTTGILTSGTLLARAQFTDETPSGWQQVNFPTPVAIAAGTLYVASYHTDVGFYAVTQNFFSNSGFDNPPLHAPSVGNPSNPGLFEYSTVPTFPTGTIQGGNNYFVDVVFTQLQTITFTSTPPANPAFGGSYTVAATGGGSGNPLVFSIDSASASGACSVLGSTVSFTGTGTCVIDANQAGNTNYDPAAQQQQSFTIGKASQAITFTSTPPANPVAGGSYTVAASGGGSGNAVTFSIDASSTAGACSSSGATVTFNAAGTCVIDANQAGNSNYLAADQAQQTLRVNPPTPSSICTLTKQYVQGSAKYQALPAPLKAAVDKLVTAVCQKLDALIANLTPAQKAALITAYKQGVNALAATGWLTPAQAAQLKTLAAQLL